MRMLTTMVLAIALFTTGCSTVSNTDKVVNGSNANKSSVIQPSSMTAPTLSEIKDAKVSLNIPSPNGSTSLTPTSPHDRAVLQKVIGWLQTAEAVGDEDLHQPMPSEGPTTLVLQLTNGMEILIQPASNCTTTGNSTVCKYAQGYVDFQYADSTHKLRLHSPELDTWLLGTWKNDVQSHHS
ncbi:hypothetical protein [Alicyclobacillus mengziensis]|uniref:Lipoprotein n=1 Tax=Alicyclobacillus mengziensis TaxID=2931921 RepID=A0A9X7VXW3_9BACL|nr:hypothetical protein [Alicyclobacillus mengziensis]QSO46709.1 hypothetical protein JZ786_20060 [Alicyclobacillus mengziensis]